MKSKNDKTNCYRNVNFDLPILALRGAEEPCIGGFCVTFQLLVDCMGNRGVIK